MEKIYQVDAFTDKPFTGNPAGVCLFSGKKPDELMQNIAMEMNLSETAFLWPEGEGYRLRWFTPGHEEELCGHATLSAAHVLWEQGLLKPDEQAVFFTRSGRLSAVKRIDGGIVLDFPAEPAREAAPPEGLTAALGLTGGQVLFCGQNRMDYLLEVESERLVRNLEVDFAALRRIAREHPFRGVIVTAKGPGAVVLEEGLGKKKRADRRFHCVSRFFTPEPEVPEDPVTGSAHCCIGPYWAAKLNEKSLLAYQASARGGVIGIAVKPERVELAGKAVTVLEGTLRV